MRCPACGNPLVVTTIEGLDLHDCPHCQGVWLEGDQLRRVEEDEDPSLDWLADDLFAAADGVPADGVPADGVPADGVPAEGGGAAAGSRPARRCPRCDQPMVTLAYPHSKVQVDVCRTDRGIWLDRGEFERIIAALEDEIDAMDPAGYGRHAAQELRELFGRGGSKARELRDLFNIVHLLNMRLAVRHPQVAAAADDIAARGL